MLVCLPAHHQQGRCRGSFLAESSFLAETAQVIMCLDVLLMLLVR